MLKTVILIFLSLFLVSCEKSVSMNREGHISTNTGVVQTESLDNTGLTEKMDTGMTIEGQHPPIVDATIEPFSLIDFTNPKIDPKSLNEYKEMLAQLSDKTASGELNLYDESIAHTAILNEHSELLLRLFQEGFLPTLKTFIIGDKEYFVTVGFNPGSHYSQKKENYWNGKVNCGAISVPGGEYTGSCIIIDKEYKKIIIDRDIRLKDWAGEPAFEVIQGKYLIAKTGDGDMCGISSGYSLFDSDLKKISQLYISYGGCDGEMTTTFTKGDSEVSFYSNQNSNNEGKEKKEEKLYESGNFSSLTYLKKRSFSQDSWGQYLLTKNFLYISDSTFRFDILKNLLNGDVFSFTLNNKETTIDLSKQQEWDERNPYFSEISMKKISGGYEISGARGLMNELSIKSCKDNGNAYDEAGFTPKSFNKETGTFTYRISQSFGNLCQIPYEFTYKIKNDPKSYSQKVKLVLSE